MAEGESRAEVVLQRLVIDRAREQCHLELRERAGARRLRLPIGVVEAAAYDWVLREGAEAAQPLPRVPHALLLQLLAALAARLLAAELEPERAGWWPARLLIEAADGSRRQLLCRAVDAILVAHLDGAPILAAPGLFAER
ncbi:MAG: hypothetical protein KatS3mg102_1060 [Planctomycetota bacterium]|nr:MAG: hypothetical protein KatS3mg102_1060 [Planctomycetota bacterium]